MNGWSYDYFLAIDNTNCPLLDNIYSQAVKDDINNVIQGDIKNIPETHQKYFTENWENYCDFITWAYIESIELIEKDDQVEKAYNTCKNAYQTKGQKQFEAEKKYSKIISSNEVRKSIISEMTRWQTIPATKR